MVNSRVLYTKYVLIKFIILFFLTSCAEKNTDNKLDNIKTEIIPTKNKSKFNLNEAIKDKEYIILENNKNSMFSNLDKTIIKDGKIYIMDISGLHYIYVYNINGKFIRRIGSLGDGPFEYRKIIDFDVDEEGNVYILDYQRMKLRKYSVSGDPLEARNIPFRAYGFTILDKNKYIFSMTHEIANEETDTYKVVVTDTNFSVKNKYFTFDSEDLDNRHSVGVFTKNQYGILYNKPVNDTLFIFDKSGKIKKAYKFDFGESKVPDEMRLDYEKVVSQRKEGKVSYLYQMPLLVKDILVGNLFVGNDKGIFTYDTKNKIYSQMKFNESPLDVINVNLPIASYENKFLYTYLDFSLISSLNKENIPKEVVNHINDNEGKVLIKYTLK